MKVRILGAHQGESDTIRFTSFLVDGKLVIDAGGLTSALSLEEQLAVDAVLITHRHFDHIKDLPGFAFNRWEQKGLDLYCTDSTQAALQAHIFNDVVWPSMTHTIMRHPLVFHSVRAGVSSKVLDYEVLPLETSHTVPVVGYYVEGNGGSLFYTGDTRAEDAPSWAHVRPDLLLAETTMSSDHDAEAERVGHMTPLSLGRALRAFHKKQGYYPQTVCVHINPHHEGRIREEITALAQELGADIRLGSEGMEIDVFSRGGA